MKLPILIYVVAVVAAVGSFAQGLRPADLDPKNAVAVPPIRMFDNLYYVGTNYVCSYVLKTSAGLILIDTLYDKWTGHVPDAMHQLGLDPKEIKYILITHGHTDHFGGAKGMQQLSGARVGMTEVDWGLMEKSNRPPPEGIVKRDMVIKDGDTLTLGDTTLKFYITPGHTPGVLSMEFPVFDRGKQYKAFLFGGHNVTSNQVQAYEVFIQTVERLQSTLTGVDVNLTSHPWAALILERGEKLAKRAQGDTNPYVGPQEFKAFLDERLADARKRLEEARQAHKSDK